MCLGAGWGEGLRRVGPADTFIPDLRLLDRNTCLLLRLPAWAALLQWPQDTNRPGGSPCGRVLPRWMPSPESTGA